jgi:biotin carboxyl carrier protein
VDVVAPTSGIVNSIEFADGDVVQEGESVVGIECMKLLTPIEAPCAGVITYLTQPGVFVQEGEVVATIEEA